MTAPIPAATLSVTVLVDTEVPAAGGAEDGVARPSMNGAALLSPAVVIHVGTDWMDDEAEGGGEGGAAAGCPP